MSFEYNDDPKNTINKLTWMFFVTTHHISIIVDPNQRVL